VKELELLSLDNITKETSIGGAITLGNRTIYPIIEVSTIIGKSKIFFGRWITPIALVIVELTQVYVFSLSSQTITLKQLIKKVPSLKKKMNQKLQ